MKFSLIYSTHPNALRLVVGTLLLGVLLPEGRAAQLEAGDGTTGDLFGRSVSRFEGIGLIGAYGDESNKGVVYVFHDLDTATGVVTQQARLAADDGVASDRFGYNVSLAGSTGLVGAYGDETNRGAAYIFRDLDTVTGTVTQNVKLIASDSATGDNLGYGVSLWGSTGLVGAYGDDFGSARDQGSAYFYRNLDTATGTITQDVKLIASDGAAGDYFGWSVNVSGNASLVGAVGDDTTRGAVYFYRDLETATGTVTQNAKLVVSDGEAKDNFGYALSQSEGVAVAGAAGDDSYKGAAYVFRNFDAATGTVNENTKLVASDRAANDYFGTAVSLSKGVALVGAYADDVGANTNEGGVYLYRNLGTATGTISENVKILASDGGAGDYFGVSVSLEGDQFLIGAMYGNGATVDSGKTYTGSVSSLTTLDAGNASRTIDGISFISQDDWVIGQTTDHNQVTLSAGDAGTVSADGKAVYIGQSAGSDDNRLVVEGRLTTSELYIGSIAGNEGNILRLNATAGQFTIESINLTAGNMLEIEGDYLNTDDLLAYLGEGTLKIWWGSEWLTVNNENAATSITSDFFSGYTTVQIVPEPMTWALFGLGAGAWLIFRRRRNIEVVADHK